MNSEGFRNAPLCSTLAEIDKAGVTDAAMLLNISVLSQQFVAVLKGWLTETGCKQVSVQLTEKTLNLTHEEMADAVLAHLLTPGSDQAQPFKRLNALLNISHEQSPEAAERYLLRVTLQYAQDLQRAQKRLKTAPAVPEDMAAFLDRCGKDVPAGLARLAQAAGCSRNAVVEALIQGRQVEFLRQVTKRLNSSLECDLTQALSGFEEQLSSYVLPDRFRKNPDALAAHLCRKLHTPAPDGPDAN